MPSPRSLSRSFERRTVPRSFYRQVHLNGLLQLEDQDYRWIEQGRILAFDNLHLSEHDTLLVSLPGQRPQQIELEGPLPAGTPLNVLGVNSILTDIDTEEVVEVLVDAPTLYDHLLEE